jgi:hypothetical protein
MTMSVGLIEEKCNKKGNYFVIIKMWYWVLFWCSSKCCINCRLTCKNKKFTHYAENDIILFHFHICNENDLIKALKSLPGFESHNSETVKK